MHQIKVLILIPLLFLETKIVQKDVNGCTHIEISQDGTATIVGSDDSTIYYFTP